MLIWSWVGCSMWWRSNLEFDQRTYQRLGYNSAECKGLHASSIRGFYLHFDPVDWPDLPCGVHVHTYGGRLKVPTPPTGAPPRHLFIATSSNAILSTMLVVDATSCYIVKRGVPTPTGCSQQRTQAQRQQLRQRYIDAINPPPWHERR